MTIIPCTSHCLITRCLPLLSIFLANQALFSEKHVFTQQPLLPIFFVVTVNFYSSIADGQWWGCWLWCLMSLSAIFQSYRGVQFCWWEIQSTFDLLQVTDKLYHIMTDKLRYIQRIFISLYQKLGIELSEPWIVWFINIIYTI